MTKEILKEALAKHLPAGAVEACADMVVQYHVHLNITRSRLSKYGDYRSPFRGKGHRISLNHNLNPYMFLITFVHEMAHLTTYNVYKHKVEPHGKQWKSAFRELMDPFLKQEIFPGGLRELLENYMMNPSATKCSDPELFKALKSFDEQNHFLFLETLPEGCQFKIKGYANVFVKGKKLRKTYLCSMQDSKRSFRVSALAEVQQVSLF